MTTPNELSRRERQIMDVLYARGEASVLEIQSELPDPPTATAIRTMLHILNGKGLLKRRKQGREFIYAPRKVRRKAGTNALSHVVETFFDGSFANALAAQLASGKGKFTDDEMREMVKLIQDARKKGK